MKIVIAASIFPPDIGGPASYSKFIAEELVRQGNQVRIVCFADSAVKTIVPPLEIVRIKRTAKVLSHLAYALALWRASAGYDVIYAQGVVAGGWQSWIIAKLRNMPFIVKIVGDYAWEQGSQRYGIKQSIDIFQQARSLPWQVKFLKFVQRQVTSKANKVIVPSKYLAGLVEQWGVEKSRIEVIYNSFSGSAVGSAEVNAFKQKYNISGPLILSVGRLMPWKGNDILLTVWPEILKQNPLAKLMIIGSGTDEARLIKLQDQNNLQSSVVFTGALPHNQVQIALQVADVYVLLSAYEGLSHLLLEALAAQTTVIASDIGGNLEVIVDGVNGYLCQRDNPDRLVERIGKILSAGENSLINKSAVEQSLTKFSSEHMIAATVLALQNCIKNQR